MIGLTGSSAVRALFGAVAWAVVTIYSVRDLRSFQWSSALLLFAALVLVPLILELVREVNEVGFAKKLLTFAELLQLPAAMLLMLASTQPPGIRAAGLAGPWIGVTVLIALAGAWRIWRRGATPQWALCRDMGLVFLAVGGAWTLAEKLGFDPLGFGSDIVQLTAVHFHYAGFILPVITGLVLRESGGNRLGNAIGWSVLSGVPLVAIGITVTRFGGGQGVELVSAVVLGFGAVGGAGLQLKLAGQTRWPWRVRVLWSVASVALGFGMILAVLYASRSYFMPLPWLDIPWMRALHGTANGVGFAACASLGWWLARPRDKSRG